MISHLRLPSQGNTAAAPVFGLGGGSGTPIVSLSTPFTFSFTLSLDLAFESGGAGGVGNVARCIFNDGRGMGAGRFTTRCSFSSPGTIGSPAAAASAFHWNHGSPPASSISSLMIVVDHFSCRSRVCCWPSTVVGSCGKM